MYVRLVSDISKAWDSIVRARWDTIYSALTRLSCRSCIKALLDYKCTGESVKGFLVPELPFSGPDPSQTLNRIKLCRFHRSRASGAALVSKSKFYVDASRLMVSRRLPEGPPKVPEGSPKVPQTVPEGPRRFPEGPNFSWRFPETPPKVPEDLRRCPKVERTPKVLAASRNFTKFQEAFETTLIH